MPDLTTKDALLEKIVELTGQIKDKIVTALGKYLPLSGGTMTGAIKGNPLTLTGDDGEGNSADLLINADGTLILNGNDITPQKSTTKNTPSSVSVPDNTTTNLLSFTLEKGTWFVQVIGSFASNATGFRQIVIATSETGGNADRYKNFRGPAVDGTSTVITFSTIIEVASTTTYYVNVTQTSGSTLNVDGGYKIFRLSSIN